MYQSQARGLASLGRNDDSMLVHMTPGEVQGLQKLAMSAGGSLTINPQTGLPEAGFLSNLLPTIIGVGVGVATQNPYLGAAAAGALGYAQNGSLMQGLSAGASAYSGTGLLTGLEQVGSTALAADAVQQQAVTSGLSNASTLNLANQAGGLGESVEQLAAQQLAEQQAQQLAAQQLPAQQAQQLAAEEAAKNAGRMGNMRAGISNVTDSFGNFKSFLSATPTGDGSTGFSNKTNLMGVAAPVVMGLGQDLFSPRPNSGTPTTEPDQYDRRLARYRLSPDFKVPEVPRPSPYYQATYPTYYSAAGGVTPLPRRPSMPDGGTYVDPDPDTQSQDPYTATMMRLNKISKRANIPNYLAMRDKTNVKGLGDVQPMATGGHLGGYSDGGRLLKGPGDGMSDSIPASINQKQPAALADGEFVVPADVVSHLGNGSTDAGAKKLYAMMDKVRRARTGNKKQGKQINPARFMPT